MSKSRELLVRLTRTLVYLAIVGMVIALSAIVASRITIAQLRAMLPAEMLSAGAAPAQMAPAAANAEAQLVTGPIPGTVELDLYEALGLSQAEFVELLAANPHLRIGNAYTLALTIGNGRGDHLAEGDVILRWGGGQMVQHIGVSGVLAVRVSEAMLPGLRIVVPEGYTVFRQTSLPGGTAYEPDESFDEFDLPDAARKRLAIVSDNELTTRLRQALVKIRDARSSLDGASLLEQLARGRSELAMDAVRSAESAEPAVLTPAEIHRQRRDSVVVVGHLFRDGNHSAASGVVVHPSGVIATAYHVMNKSTAVARAVMLADGRAFPVVEILAADMAHDVALIRVDATDLPASPIAVGDGAGTPVTVIAHPGGCFYNLTQGHISRYFGVTRYGRSAVQMAVTAEFADGSSGGAIFNDRGELTGIVSATNQIGNQMVYRTAAPAFLLRRLTNEPTEPSGNP